MDQLIKFIQAIADESFIIVFAGSMLYLLVKGINLLYAVVEKLIDKRLGNKKHDKALKLRTDTDNKVYDKLNEFLVKHKATRVMVVEYTNSVMSVAYLPFRYMSCTYEVVAYGHDPKAKYIDKLSTSLFSEFLTTVSKNNYTLLDKAKTDRMAGAVDDVFESIDSRYQICAPMKSKQDKNIGFIAMCSESEPSMLDKHDVEILSHDISTLLGVLDK